LIHPTAAIRSIGSLFAICAVIVSLAVTVRAGPAETANAAHKAVAWLESVQNADGSWGADVASQSIYTASVVDALRDSGNMDPPYYRGVTWLENHAAPSIDMRARRISALVPHGDDLSLDRAELVTSFRANFGAGAGWGLSAGYEPSAVDTALAVIALSDLGVTLDIAPSVQAGLDYLKSSRTPDNGWSVRGASQLDPIVTAYVLRALARGLAIDSTVQAIGDGVITHLNALCVPSTDLLVKAHCALGLSAWKPTLTVTNNLVNYLINNQSAAGDWQSSIYVAATALKAFAIKLGTNDPTLQTVVSLPDFSLRSAINLALGRNRADAVRRIDARSLTILTARGLGISDLTGLSEMTNLVTLDLRDNPITDVSAISGLTSLQKVLLQHTPWAGRLCDINGDGRIDSGDSYLGYAYSQSLLTPSLLQRTRADVAPVTGPGDGIVNAGDLVVLMNAGQGANLPVCSP
jgi:prenyltransferase/squalene oxidase-like repeat protein